jgi:glutamine cyclotransferase
MSKAGRRRRERRAAGSSAGGARKPRRGSVILWCGAAAAIALTLLLVGTRKGPSAAASADQPVRYGYRVVNVFPHDRDAFTQGLVYRDGFLYESTGLQGKSSLRKVRLETGEVVEQRAIDAQYFAEGLADFGDQLFQLTWRPGSASCTGWVTSSRSARSATRAKGGAWRAMRSASS